MAAVWVDLRPRTAAMRASLTVAFTLLAAVGAAAPAWAESLVVPIDHSTRIAVQGSAASVVIGNPQVADVTVVDSHTLFVSGRGYGQTDVVVLDRSGRTIFSGDVIVAAAGSGRVSVYRGGDRTDMACAPACSVSTRSPIAPSKEGSASTAGSAPSNPMAGMAAGIGGAVNGMAGAAANGASAVGGALSPSPS
jgi:hypothetical protein